MLYISRDKWESPIKLLPVCQRQVYRDVFLLTGGKNKKSRKIAD